MEEINIVWKPAYMIIPTCYPPLFLFEDVASQEEFEFLYELENMTNPRMDDVDSMLGDVELVPIEDRVYGHGATCIMGAFTHPNVNGDRFTDGTYGVFYASNSLECAVYETAYHRSQFFKISNEPKCEIEMRVYNVDIDTKLVDIREDVFESLAIYHKSNYTESQKLAKELKRLGKAGLVYNSVRYINGENVAIFKPKSCSNCREMKNLKYVWDGKKINGVYEISGARLINYTS
ncbi:MAG: hypothetical protein C0603_08130 [Denitrovibrio sp.]|nr:MAG: hypothetical protein C0603_08130 [Denitrovibrio sp.]